MITINLTDFTSHDFKDVYKFVMLQTQDEYEIVINKKNQAGADENFDVFWEYHILAYAGQKLNALASHFTYNVPAAGTKQPFKFIVTIDDQEKFADLLYELVVVFTQFDDMDPIMELRSPLLNFLMMLTMIREKLQHGAFLKWPTLFYLNNWGRTHLFAKIVFLKLINFNYDSFRFQFQSF